MTEKEQISAEPGTCDDNGLHKDKLIGQQESGWLLKPLHVLENTLLAVAIGAMVLLPLAASVARRFFQYSIAQSSTVTQHLVLITALLGAAVAARHLRLLALSTLADSLKGRVGIVARMIASAAAAAVSAGLAYAGWSYLQIESGLVIVGIKLEHLLWLMPVTYGLIGLRLIWNSGTQAGVRLGAALLASVFFGLPCVIPLSSGLALSVVFGVLLFSAVLGMPIFTILGGAALVLFLAKGEPLAAVSISQYDMAVNPTLPAVPLFTLAGYFLAEGGTSRRLVRLFQALFAHLRGGAGVMTVVVCAFFTSFTGASGVTILALGGILLPVLLDAKYSERTALGIITGAGSLGLLLPPCLPLILYAIVASNSGMHLGISVSIGEMFAGGIVPGLLLSLLAGALVILQQPKHVPELERFSFRKAASAVWIAKWELLLPILAIGALLGGYATPVEAAAVTAFYAFLIETFVYRDLKPFRDTTRVLVECGLLVGGILLILGVAMGLTNYLVDAQIPDLAVDWAKSAISAPWVFLIMLNFLLLIAGCLMDIFSAIVIIVPIIVPVAIAFGIEPVHLGVIFLANLQLGYLTPPVGMNLFMTSYRFGKPMSEVIRATLPMLGVFAIGVILITFIPQLSMWLPRILNPTGR